MIINQLGTPNNVKKGEIFLQSLMFTEPRLIRSRKRKDEVGYDVHIIFYTCEDKNINSLGIMMATRLINNNEVTLVPYAFEKWDEANSQLIPLETNAKNWGEMLEFANSLGISTLSIKNALQREEMEEFLLEEFKFIFKDDFEI